MLLSLSVLSSLYHARPFILTRSLVPAVLSGFPTHLSLSALSSPNLSNFLMPNSDLHSESPLEGKNEYLGV